MNMPLNKKTPLKKIVRMFQNKHNQDCKICGKKFKPRFNQDLFCNSCKSNSDRYEYSDWIPEFKYAC